MEQDNFDTAKKYFRYYSMAFEKSFKPAGFTYCKIKTNEMCMFETAKELLFIFKGTDEWKDWGVNLRFLHKEDKSNWESHNGFRESAESFEKEIARKIKYTDPKKEISFVGYSLGGAIAIISAINFTRKYENRKFKCITFGQPRVYGDDDIHKMIKKMDSLDYYRVYFKDDIVANIPLKTCGYCHLPAKELILKRKWWHKLGVFGTRLIVQIFIHKLYRKAL